MLLMLAQYLENYYSAFNVFSYLTMRAILGALTALVISFVIGPRMISKLSVNQLGQPVREEGPETHLLKAGTPTMGGALILTAIAVSTVLWANLENLYVWVVLFVTLSGESWFVLGDMKELGADEQRLHAEVGEALRAAGIDRLFATGDLCRSTAATFGENANWYDTVDELAADVLAELSASVNVLVKGSRSMRMERVVDALRATTAIRAEA